MALIIRRDAIVFLQPPAVKYVNGVKYTKFVDQHYHVDEETGDLVSIESWWTDADILAQNMPPDGLKELSPPEPGEIYYEGPVWAEDPARTKEAVRKFVDALPIPEASCVFVFRAKRRGNQIVFYCDHCRHEHFHGGVGGGHRAAHCDKPNSPYEKTGYVLTLQEG